jgi:hypothetical protein
MTTPDIAAAMTTAMQTEDHRRQLASATPGLGSPVVLPDLPYHSQGLGPVVGENHQTTAAIANAVHKAYGPPRPEYGHPLIGGLDYAPLDAGPALRSSLYELADQVFAAQDARAGHPYTVISPPARPGLLARLAARLRRR